MQGHMHKIKTKTNVLSQGETRGAFTSLTQLTTLPRSTQKDFSSIPVCQSFLEDLKRVSAQISETKGKGKQSGDPTFVHLVSFFFWAFKTFLSVEHFFSVRGNPDDISAQSSLTTSVYVWQYYRLFYSWEAFFFSSVYEPLLLHHLPFQQVPLLTTLYPPSSSSILCVLPHSVAPPTPSHLSFLHLPTTNHNLFTTPWAHSTTLLARIADLFIPDNAEGWRLWFDISPSVYATVWLPELHTR